MREAIGGTWLFGLVITFIVFFASFLAISINYSKAFNVKNNIVDLIGKYEGNNPCTRKQIGNYLSNIGYLVPGPCPKDNTNPSNDYTAYNLNGDVVTSGDNRGYYCIANVDVSSASAVVEKKYYRVIVFFKFDLPIIGDLTTFRVKGETESIYFANEINAC